MRTRNGVPAKVWLAGAAIATCGCAQVLGADDYRVSRVSGAGGAQNDEPAPAYLQGPECTACLASACDTQVAACNEDEDCKTWVDDMVADPSPNGAYRRDGRRSRWHAAGATRDGPGTLYGADEVDLLSKLQTCSETYCLDACQLGSDFTCVGDFDWHIVFPPALTLRVEGFPVGDDQADPWTVRACAANLTSCEPALQTGSTGEEGYLTLDMAAYDNGAPFAGYLTFDTELLPTAEGPVYRSWAGFSSRPLGPEHITTWIPIQRFLIERYYSDLRAAYDPGFGYLTVQPYDCRGLEAKHVRIEVKLERGTEVIACDECEVTYETNAGTPTTGLDPFSTAAGIAHVTYVPAGRARVLMVRTSDETVVASVPITVDAGRYHAIKAYPLTSNER